MEGEQSAILALAHTSAKFKGNANKMEGYLNAVSVRERVVWFIEA